MKREDQPCMRFMRGNNTYERNMRRFDLREAKKRVDRRWLHCSTVLRDLCRALGEGNGTPLQYCCPENPMDGGAWWAAVHGVAKSQTRLSDFTFTFHFHALEKEMATHSSVLAWRIPQTEKPGRLQSMGLHRVGHDWSDLAAAAAKSDWLYSLQPAPCLSAMQETGVWSLGQEDPLEKEMATHSTILAWTSPGTEEPCVLQSMRSQKSWIKRMHNNNSSFILSISLKRFIHLKCVFLYFILRFLPNQLGVICVSLWLGSLFYLLIYVLIPPPLQESCLRHQYCMS